ncbi:MAG: carboxypeptidase-like regulatory domain-containing protein [Pseudomonadota bacterium]|nr:carboxypeptidase-like regulatory domain-containing protein [Pseudomonadota bacterium]
MKKPLTLLTMGMWMLLLTASAFAHGLLVKVRGEGNTVSGTVYYSNGTPGAGEWVQLTDLSHPAMPPQGVNAGPDGSFRFVGIQERRYRIVVAGEEGHSVTSELTLTEGARGQFVDDDAPAKRGWTTPPAWLVIGGLLLLSIIPAVWLRRRGKR